MNLLFDALLVYLAIRLLWGAYKYFGGRRPARPRSEPGPRRKGGRFDLKGKNVQDAEFEEIRKTDK